MRRAAVLGVLGAVLLAAGCRKLQAGASNPVQAIRRRVELRFRPPADGLLTDAQLDLFVRSAREGGGQRAGQAGSAIDPVELEWVRGRIIEALIALDAKRVTGAALEVDAKAIADLQAARRGARDPRTAARLDVEIAALERERASLTGGGGSPTISSNAARIAPRRAEIESLGP